MIRRTPLKRSRTPIRKVGSKRRSANQLYSKLRKGYLLLHPWCQIFMKRRGIDEAVVKANNGAYPITTPAGVVHWKQVPLATTIHHKKKPKQTYLNDTTTWLSGSWAEHEWVENNKSLAREMGLLDNI